jgi:hypothetical protein
MPTQPTICTDFFHAAYSSTFKKEAAGYPEILVPFCQTAPYQILTLIAMTTSNLIFGKLPRKEKKRKGGGRPYGM